MRLCKRMEILIMMYNGFVRFRMMGVLISGSGGVCDCRCTMVGEL